MGNTFFGEQLVRCSSIYDEILKKSVISWSDVRIIRSSICFMIQFRLILLSTDNWVPCKILSIKSNERSLLLFSCSIMYRYVFHLHFSFFEKIFHFLPLIYIHITYVNCMNIIHIFSPMVISE